MYISGACERKTKNSYFFPLGIKIYSKLCRLCYSNTLAFLHTYVGSSVKMGFDILPLASSYKNFHGQNQDRGLWKPFQFLLLDLHNVYTIHSIYVLVVVRTWKNQNFNYSHGPARLHVMQRNKKKEERAQCNVFPAHGRRSFFFLVFFICRQFHLEKLIVCSSCCLQREEL